MFDTPTSSVVARLSAKIVNMSDGDILNVQLEQTYPYAFGLHFANRVPTVDIQNYNAQSRKAWERLLSEKQKTVLVNTALRNAESVQKTQGGSEVYLWYSYKLNGHSLEIGPSKVLQTEVLPLGILPSEFLPTTDWNLTDGGIVDGGLTVSTENRHRRTHHSHRHSSGRRRQTHQSSRHSSRPRSRARRRQPSDNFCTIF